MSDKVKAIVFGVLAGFALGGLIGSATFGGWGGIVGSLFGVVAGGGTMGLLAGASLAAQAENGESETKPTEAEIKP